MRTCSVCMAELELSGFYPQPNGGHRRECKACTIAAAGRRYRDRNGFVAGPETAESWREAMAEWIWQRERAHGAAVFTAGEALAVVGLAEHARNAGTTRVLAALLRSLGCRPVWITRGVRGWARLGEQGNS